MLEASSSSLVVKTLGMSLFAFSPSLSIGAATYAIIVFMVPVQKALLDGHIQLAVPSGYQGRIGSLNQMAKGIAALAAFLSGAMARFLGVWLAIVLASDVVTDIGVWSVAELRHHRVEGW